MAQDNDKEKIIQPPVESTIVRAAQGAPATPTPISAVNDPMLQGSTPVTPEELAMMQSGTSPYTATAPKESIPQAVPYPEPGPFETLGAFIPGLGLVTGKAYMEKTRKASEMKKADINAIGFWEKIMEKNPRQAGELLKTPVFRDAFMRQQGATGEDIENISATMANKQLTPKEIIDVYNAGAMLDAKSGEIVPRPIGVEKEVEYKKELFKQYETAAKKDHADWSDLDVITHFNDEMLRKTGESEAWTGLTSGDYVTLWNRSTGAIKQIPNRQFIDMDWQIVQDEKGTFGIAGVSKKARINPETGRPEAIPHIYFSIQEIMKDADPRDIDIVYGHKPGWAEIMKRYIQTNLGINPDMIKQQMMDPDNPNLSTQITPPSTPPLSQDWTYAGPAANQTPTPPMATPQVGGTIPPRALTEQEMQEVKGAVGDIS